MVPRKLAGIEAARGIAALGVVLFHATMTMGPDASGALPLHGLFAFSYLGVEFFFVLSGFMVWYAHGKLLDRPDRLGEFLWRRAARIYPTLWVVLVAAVLAWEILAALGLPRHDWRTEGGWRLLATILAWPVTTPPHLLNVVWTLPLEILFYLIFAVGIWNRRLGLMVLGGWQAMILAANLFWTTDPDSFLWRINHLDFGLGILAAVALASRPPARPLTLAAAGATLLLAAGLAADFGLIGQATRGLKVFTGLCSAAIVLGLVEAERRGRLGTPAPLVRLGAASYSVFLVHLMAIHLFLALAGLCAWTRSLPRDALFLGAVVAAIGFGLLFWRFVETPLVHFFASITIGRPARRTS